MAFQDFNVVIPRHCVPSNEQGLSPLQDLTLHSPKKIRILSAPTGAGKSYAFRRAMTDRQERILFIVPTRRLAQNLFAALKQEIFEAGISSSFEDSGKYASLWTSDERDRLKSIDPNFDVAKARILQVLGAHEEKGRMIVATPESVASRILPGMFRSDDLRSFGIVNVVNQFDHIVFDEFHTIDARGFGLAATFAGLTAKTPSLALKVTFLSATPVDIVPVLASLDIPMSEIVVENETVITGSKAQTVGARPLHGDVTLKFHSSKSLSVLAEQHADEIQNSLSIGQQIIFVYDSRQQLIAQKPKMAAIFRRFGLQKSDMLEINSTSDSAKGDLDPDFTQGSASSPENYKMLIATSSVEMGVTFKTNLMFTDPGHDILSLVQRIGRVSRGDLPGTVHIRISEDTPDFRHLLADISTKSTIDIQSFLKIAMLSATKRFTDESTEPKNIDTFRSLPGSAVWCSALFWYALRETQWGGARRTIEHYMPSQARLIGAMLSTIGKTRTGKAWQQAFLNETKTLRNIAPTIECRLNGKCAGFIPQRDMLRFPSLAFASIRFEEKDPNRPIIDIYENLSAIYGEEKLPYRDTTIEALFPHKAGATSILSSEQVTSWVRTARAAERGNSTPFDRKEGIREAIRLVQLTKIVPTTESIAFNVGGAIIL